MCDAQICGAVVPVGARDFPEISRDLEEYSPRFDDVTKVEDQVKVKVKAEVKYANEGRHIGILRLPWPMIGSLGDDVTELGHVTPFLDQKPPNLRKSPTGSPQGLLTKPEVLGSARKAVSTTYIASKCNIASL